MEKFIFLDVDGVTNTERFIEAARLLRAETRDEYSIIYDPTVMRYLNGIVEETRAKYVISSTWRAEGLKYFQDMWEGRGYKGEVIACTPFSRLRHRGAEINEWLVNHLKDKDDSYEFSYIILDDDSDMLDFQAEHRFVQTCFSTGVVMDDIPEIYKCLNKPVSTDEKLWMTMAAIDQSLSENKFKDVEYSYENENQTTPGQNRQV